MAEPRPSPLGSRKSAAAGLRIAGLLIFAALFLVACGSDGGSQDVSTASEDESSDNDGSGDDTETDDPTGSSSGTDGDSSASSDTSDSSGSQEPSTDPQDSTATTAESASSEEQTTTTAGTDQIDKSSVFVKPDKSVPTITPSTIASETSDELSKQVIGMSEADAIALVRSTGRGVRVEMRDGEEFMLTQDYSPDRLNLTVVKDEVTAVRLG